MKELTIISLGAGVQSSAMALESTTNVIVGYFINLVLVAFIRGYCVRTAFYKLT